MNLAITLSLPASLLLAACAAPQQRIQYGASTDTAVTVSGPASKTPLLACRKRDTFKVRVVEVSAASMDTACYRMGTINDPKKKVRGCSRFDEPTQTLTVLVSAPEYLEDVIAFAHIGHELWHGRCVENFHE